MSITDTFEQFDPQIQWLSIMMFRLIRLIYIPFMIFGSLAAQPTTQLIQDDASRMEWFRDAKLGIFIHYGIYAVDGVDESWAFYNKKMSYESYMEQLKGFTARNYDATRWAEIIAMTGAKYAILTTRHHDGVALWDTDYGNLNVVRDTPAGRDLVAPFVDAVRHEGLKVGLYYSHSDWSHPDYPTILANPDKPASDRNPFSDPAGEEDFLAWERFLVYHRGQIKELSDRFQPDLFWFDGDWERTAEQWGMSALRDSLLTWQPSVILNSRMNGYGDYATPEAALPIFRPDEDIWEFCMTTNDNWGYQHSDQHYKSPAQVISIFAEVLGKGGNLLLNMGPMEDGAIPEPQMEVFYALGNWTEKHTEAIYGTKAGLPPTHYAGPSSVSPDGKTLYLFLDAVPEGKIRVKGLKNRAESVRVVGVPNSNLAFDYFGPTWHAYPQVLNIKVPAAMADTYTTVIAIELDGPLETFQR